MNNVKLFVFLSLFGIIYTCIYAYILYLLYTSKHYYILGIVIANLLYATIVYISISGKYKRSIKISDLYTIFCDIAVIIFFSISMPFSFILHFTPFNFLKSQYI
jgi:hypothetical protein